MAPSFLIVRFSAIGDCVMAAYIATAIRGSEPCHLTWAVETRCMPMLDSASLLDEIVDFPRDKWRKARWSPKVWQAQLATFGKLRKRSYDFGMDLQGHSKTAICLRIAGPKERIAAFATDSLAKRLNPLAPGDPDAKHRVERMLDTARTFGDFRLTERPTMPQPLSIEELGLDTAKPLATISSGAGAVFKQYPAEGWKQVARELLANGYQVAFLGAAPDPYIEVPGALTFIGKFNLHQTMSAVAHSKIHLAADTGTGHMAAAFGVPFVSVFGQTDPKLYRPYSDLGIVLRESERPEDVKPGQILKAVAHLVG